MSILSRAPALALFALVAAPFAACGGAAPGSSCAPYCQATLTCVDPSTCVLVDPAGAQAACVSACQAGFAALTAGEGALVSTCLDCIVQGATGGCEGSLSLGACGAQCDGADTRAAGRKWQTANQVAASSFVGQCTNGHTRPQLGELFGFDDCSGEGDSKGCSVSCCIGTSCVTPDVGLACTGGPVGTAADCTCTAGKNQGMAVQATGCVGSPWVLCTQ